MKKHIKIPRRFYKKLNYHISIPLFWCPQCELNKIWRKALEAEKKLIKTLKVKRR